MDFKGCEAGCVDAALPQLRWLRTPLHCVLCAPGYERIRQANELHYFYHKTENSTAIFRLNSISVFFN